MGKTHIHFPTDLNLLWDAVRKILILTAQLCEANSITTWRQSKHHLKQVKRAYRKVQKIKHSTSKNPVKQAMKQQQIIEAHENYLKLAMALTLKVKNTLAKEKWTHFSGQFDRLAVHQFIIDAERQIDQITRRVLKKEKIPHNEKVFSLFQPHSEWISKGKAGVPVEFGIRICILEDQYGFILHHKVMQKQTDDQVAVSMVSDTQKDFSDLSVCSYDKGFHSKANQIDLKKYLDLVVLPKKGRCNKAEKEHQSSEAFCLARKKHSAVESGINALQVHGVNKCLDHGIVGFKRYVSLGVLARNIQKLGSELQKQEQVLLKKAA